MRKKLQKKTKMIEEALREHPDARLADLAKAVYRKSGAVTKKRAQRLRDYILAKAGTV